MPSELVPVVVVLILIALALGWFQREAHAQRLRRALDERPLDVQVSPPQAPQQAASQAPPPAPAPARGLEQRLTELDGLLLRGVISEEEHRAARARIIADG